MNIAGIDMSTRAIDVVLLSAEGEGASWHRYELGEGDLIERVRSAGGFRFWRPWQWEDCLAVGIERPAGRHGVAQVAMVFGAVLCSLPARLLVQPWQPSSWKRAVGLKGNAPKVDVASWTASRRLNDVPWPQDACDAYAIAAATKQVIRLEEGAE